MAKVKKKEVTVHDRRRFWSKVDVHEPHSCWEWQGALNGQGYGTFSLHGENRQAHRVALVLDDNAPGDQYALHQCDNRCCVNPHHLEPGSQSQNVEEMHARSSRDTAGTSHPNSKLSDDDIREIRELDGEMSREKIAVKFGITRPYVGQLIRGEYRQEVTHGES